jgi:hypothetical protein
LIADFVRRSFTDIRIHDAFCDTHVFSSASSSAVQSRKIRSRPMALLDLFALFVGPTAKELDPFLCTEPDQPKHAGFFARLPQVGTQVPQRRQPADDRHVAREWMLPDLRTKLN